MKASELRELTVDELNSKHQELKEEFMRIRCNTVLSADSDVHQMRKTRKDIARINTCLLYTSPSPRDLSTSRMPSSA